MSLSYCLYAEDDQDDIDLFREIMLKRKMDNRYICVKTGFYLFRHLQQVKKLKPYPGVILLDMQMPQMDGLEILRLLKTDDLYRLIPVIIFSTGVTNIVANDCRKLGAEIMIKPARYSDWNKVISKLASFLDE